MGDEDLTQFDPEGRRRYFSAYYYSLDATPSPEINAVLRAVARAGKMFHHTEDWNDSYYDGEEPTAAEMIQAAADEAAAIVAATEAEVARLREALEAVFGHAMGDEIEDALRALLAEEETTE